MQQRSRREGFRPKSDRLAPKVLKMVGEERSYRWIAKELQEVKTLSWIL